MQIMIKNSREDGKVEKKILTGTELKLFNHAVLEGERRSGRKLGDAIAAFLVLTLFRQMRKGEFAEFTENLADYMIAAASKNLPGIAVLRNVGDSALILTGLFPRHADRRNVSPGYYVSVGQSAYRKAGHL